jgi:protein gp37
MKKTKIDWADSTWNPVTGCLRGCEYCYARRIAERFGGASETHNNECCHECQWETEGTGEIHDLNEPIYDYDKCRNAPYPFDFDPTFHRYRLNEPRRWTKPRTIFVCSMADLFGNWVPDEWIKQVFEACEAAPQHRYLFLTKNPARYIELAEKDILPDGADNMWFGSTATTPETEFFFSGGHNTFLSIEPILKPFHDSLDAGVQACEKTDWIIVGAETGNRKDKVIPKADWIMEIVQSAEKTNTPVFMKESLRGIMGDCFRQEFPWEVAR